MDWSKAKGILIIALIISNIILLGYVSYEKLSKSDKTLRKEFSEETLKYLNSKDIKVDTEIPNKSLKLNSLTVEFESYDGMNLNGRFFDNEGVVESVKTSLTTITKDKEIVSIINKRRMLYENSKEEILFNIRSSDSAKSIAEEFLKKRGYDISDMKLNFVKEENGEYHLYFSKMYDDIPLETSYTNFVVDNRGVKFMDRLWLNVVEESQKGIYTSSAAKALLALLTKPEYHGRTIVKIEKSYYFNPEEQGYVEDITQALQGSAIPAWRIQFDNGESIGIDNY